MPIEVTSLPAERRFFPVSAKHLPRLSPSATHKILFRSLLGLTLIAIFAAGDSVLRSYKYYARVIDARLASGYLTSRPGLYAAPRTLRIGEKLDIGSLEAGLRRSGYLEKRASDVWNGSFNEDGVDGRSLEIRPGQTGAQLKALTVSVRFDKEHIVEIIADGLATDSFTLEPEVLTNDLSSKTAERRALAYTDLPPVLVHAVVSTEDRRFFDHSGVDLTSIARAIWHDASDQRIGQGGSTITQQLVKNTYLSPERSLRRKFAEAMLAIALERRLSKQDIFALYCNEIYLGQRGAFGVRGVEEAARTYFGKELKDLTLSDAAMITGMIQGPTRYSPERHPDEARARRNAVLEAMARDHWITDAQALAAENEAIALAPPPQTNSSPAPYFVDYVNRVAEDYDISGSNQRLHTTIDLDLQQLAESALKHQLDRLDVVYKNRSNKPQAALVAMDPASGDILAMVGGRNYGESQLNRATDARRQPGSTFKPLVYAAALEDGMSPVEMFSDAPRDFVYDRSRVYRPANFGGGYSMRDVTMRTGLVKSLNVVTVDVALKTGLARVANLAMDFGLPRPDRYPALALGTKEATPLEMATAYATFVNGGRRVRPKVIASVGERPGSHTGNSEEPQQLIKATTAYMITNMLSAVVDHGTARAARSAVKGTAIAGKTGTSRDGWFVGYTPRLVIAVWIGFDDNSQLGLTGAEAALPAWTEFVSNAVALRPDLGGRTFECPEGIEFVEIDSETGGLATLACPHRELIAVTQRLAPNIECSRHVQRPELDAGQETQSAAPGIVLAQHRRKPTEEPLTTMQLSPRKTTRVEVDLRGRRTLVNEMR